MPNDSVHYLLLAIAVSLTLVLGACTQPEESPTGDSNSPTVASESNEQLDLQSLKKLAAQLSKEELRALKEKHGINTVSPDHIRAWGNRATFFETMIPAFQPDVDWRTVLTGNFSSLEPEWSQGFEEVLIRNFFKDKRNGVFVDLGCAWPERGSTSCYLARELGWSGIAIDALPEYGPLWAEVRPETTFVSYAVSDLSGEIVTFFRNDWTGVSSLSKELSATRGGEENLMEIQVETTTLNDLLPQHGITKIDHLTVDIEGAEMAALRGFDIERFLPELVCVETRDLETVRGYFTAHGYELIEPYRKADKINYYFRRIKAN